MRSGAVVFRETKLKGAFIIEPDRFDDERGFFARTFCRKAFEAHGLDGIIAQSAISFNSRKGTLRGMHYQAAPHAQAKLVGCYRGAVYDVIIDLRPGSSTYRLWVAMELTEENQLLLFVPEGFAHGFQTLQDGTEVFYQMSADYHPEAERGVRFDDPAFHVMWPHQVSVISARDRSFPNFEG